tara:strand:+ start:297 stop:605 length:309 start_codon:yes stop_codon:yes gene_type:complete
MLKQVENSKIINEDEGITIEIMNLDTICYMHNLHRINIYYDRIKQDNGDFNIYIDLEDVTTWDSPKNEIISYKSANIMYNNILETLEILGLEGEIHWPNFQK